MTLVSRQQKKKWKQKTEKQFIINHTNGSAQLVQVRDFECFYWVQIVYWGQSQMKLANQSIHTKRGARHKSQIYLTRVNTRTALPLEKFPVLEKKKNYQ